MSIQLGCSDSVTFSRTEEISGIVLCVIRLIMLSGCTKKGYTLCETRLNQKLINRVKARHFFRSCAAQTACYWPILRWPR